MSESDLTPGEVTNLFVLMATADEARLRGAELMERVTGLQSACLAALINDESGAAMTEVRERLRNLNLRGGTWTCDVCKRTREDRFISTAQHALRDANGVTVLQNVKYCRDSETCTRIAHVRSRTDLAYQQAAEDRDVAIRRLWDVERARVHWIAYAALAGFVLGFLIRGVM